MFGGHIPPQPEKSIEEETKTAVAYTEHVKTDKKPFRYLYLPKSDKDLLESYLSNFKNNKELYEKMGIAYKGGILLSGEPGCGKTSSIVSIATYLNKDIYYLDLGHIKTNHELKLCIEYIKTNNRGGIVIFEDIDCTTDIVKRRDSEVFLPDSFDIFNNYITTQKYNSNNDALSLSYLLNILDGTMSPENMLFIMTTNHKELLDPALIRPGRIDISINIKKCTIYQLKQIYQDLYNKPLDKTIEDKFINNEFITAQIILHLFHNVHNKMISDYELMKNFLNDK